jgi:hypothetical protein
MIIWELIKRDPDHYIISRKLFTRKEKAINIAEALWVEDHSNKIIKENGDIIWEDANSPEYPFDVYLSQVNVEE